MAQADTHVTTRGRGNGRSPPAHSRKSAADAAKLRSKMVAAVERLITALDALDAAAEDLEDDDPGGGDINDEPQGDDSDLEPSLGSVAVNEWSSQTAWSQGNGCDLEGEHDGAEPDVEDEPSLGSFDRMVDQRKSWLIHNGPTAFWAVTDGEVDDADREDGGDAEPSLGWTLQGALCVADGGADMEDEVR